MGLFSPPKVPPVPAPPAGSLPVSQIDTTKRYDVYWSGSLEERVYENVRLVGIRTIDRPSEFSPGLGGFVEVETADGTVLLLTQFGIQLICEHGKTPAYRVVRWGRRSG